MTATTGLVLDAHIHVGQWDDPVLSHTSATVQQLEQTLGEAGISGAVVTTSDRRENAKLLDEDAESSAQYDDDWMELVSLKLTPHPKLSEEQRIILMTDYSAKDNVIEIEVRRALIGYVLQRLSVDTTSDHSMNPSAYQLIVMNRDEIEPFAGWAFL